MACNPVSRPHYVIGVDPARGGGDVCVAVVALHDPERGTVTVEAEFIGDDAREKAQEYKKKAEANYAN
jgi:hypothetical protein